MKMQNVPGLNECPHKVITRTCPTCKLLPLYDATIIRADGERFTAKEIPSKDAWAARTTVHFYTPAFWCSGQEVSYEIKESNQEGHIEPEENCDLCKGAH